MEFKVVVYIIIGIIYFLYSVGKKVEEKKTASAPEGKKPVSPPAANPLEEIMKELKRKQAEEKRKQELYNPKPQPFAQPKPQKNAADLIVHEKKAAKVEEGFSNVESVYEREVTAEEKIERGNIRLANEGIYKVESIEEMEAKEAEQAASFDFDMRNAIVGSIVLERKF